MGLRHLSLLAGWLFADLFLVLFVISLASLPPKHPSPRTSTSSPPPPPPVRVLDPPVNFYIPASSATSGLIAALKHDLVTRHLLGRQAGVLLVFAPGPLSGVSQAINTANSVIGIVRSKVSGFSGVQGSGYWSGSGNSFHFKIFFFSAQASKTSS